ncbi:hypothetical protein CKO38_18175 [Rhodospirillum rubrum]|uniref:DUF6468 domain-containing protein n=1 Tax=Rhodospirillum rubrum TaxID=1085 RepID=UPI001904D234|nr:DUF6468 domain-containing protein [Rhodospirillum rubrum]MBK1666354.1 hypothetical protein [Rhodospirillum rubrum]MBK1678545.1 hypothetical protein [Rhodospirillum rubrum]
MTIPWQVLLDGTIALLLSVFIGYAILLSRQLRELRRNREDMARIIATFNEATARAEAGIPRLRKTAEDAGRALDDHVAKAQTLRDDLAYMVERADGMAGRLESVVRAARGEARAAETPAANPRAAEGRGAPEGRALETRLSETRPGEVRGVEVRGVEVRGGDPRGQGPRGIETRGGEAPRESVPPEQDARLAAVRQRLRVRPEGGRGQGPLIGTQPLGGLGSARDEGEVPFDDERSEAERELLRALQAVR